MDGYDNDNIMESDTQSTWATAPLDAGPRRERHDNGDDEYTGESWTDSHGARHHGGGDIYGAGTEEDTEDEDQEIKTPRRRRKPARYID